jgi:hypothetical protein
MSYIRPDAGAIVLISMSGGRPCWVGMLHELLQAPPYDCLREQGLYLQILVEQCQNHWTVIKSVLKLDVYPIYLAPRITADGKRAR